ncbi:YihY/virulence factor BrkB family protein [Paracoccus sp. NGMCC 1.201697]|uniref:YihY/virulence factor BrkB family protein n=1 Tax=Paracoccus broussonetiae subsp. drimophilus TaxID=3373869 RepID=A0ABW7LG59_9RHOB
MKPAPHAPDQLAGAAAASPARIPARGWKQIFGRFRKELVEDHVSVVAAGIAFYGLLALFPSIVALVGISGLFLDPSDLGGELARYSSRLPPSAAEIIRGQVVSVTGASGTSSGVVALSGLVLAIYGSMKGVMTLIEGLNIAYDADEERGIVRLYVTGFVLTVAILFGFLITLALALLLPSIIGLLPLGGFAEAVIPWASWVILALFTMAGLAFIYRFGPSRSQPRWRWISPGAAAATLIWIIATAGFSVYVQYLGTYSETYGALGGVVILLTWLWLSAFVVLSGAELNAEIEKQATGAHLDPPITPPINPPGDAHMPVTATQHPRRLSPLFLLTGLMIWQALRRKDRDAPPHRR